jgi:hypothetical protein
MPSDTTPVKPPVPKPVRFYRSHRFWYMVSAIGGGVTTAVPTVAAIVPFAGLICKLVGVGLMIAGGAGMAYYGMASNRAVEWKLPDSITGNGKAEK